MAGKEMNRGAGVATVRSRKLWPAGVMAVAVLLAGLVGWRVLRRPPPADVPEAPRPSLPPDPRLTFATPYQNVRPEVGYVGSAACAGCHREISASYRHHPMGRSVAAAAELVADFIGLIPSGREPLPGSAVLASRLACLEHYAPAAHDPFTADGVQHRAFLQGDRMVHREARYDARGRLVAAREESIGLAIGSGTRGRSYAAVRGDSLVQSSLSWFSARARWDLSPGYERIDSHFERPIVAECLYCHTNTVAPVAGTMNRYQAPLREHAIGCERCHGPGELHVASRRRGDASEGLDPTIVNPANLEPALRESVCEQCHLQGMELVVKAGRKLGDYRPGLPYHLFWSVFVLPEELSDRHKSVTTVEQMHASACYRKSGGALGCISCHDPHELPAPEDRAAFYRGRCLQCHGNQKPAARGGRSEVHAVSCSEAAAVRQAKADDCTACHMPRLSSSDVAHTAVTDHRVPRRPTEFSATGPSRTLRPGQLPLMFFHRGQVVPDDPGIARDLGVALVRVALARHDDEAARQAIGLLQPAVHDWPEDVTAREALANALGITGRVDEAVANYDAVLAQAPDNEGYLLRAAGVAEHLGREEKAIDYYRRVLAVNPYRAAPHVGLGRLLATRHDWRPAARELEAALRLDPFDVETRKRLVEVYLQLGMREQARKEFDRVLGLSPADPAALRAWFEEQLQGRPDPSSSP